MWPFQFIKTLNIIASDGDIFLFIWLCFWIVLGITILFMLYRIFNGGKPETLTFNHSYLTINTGVSNYPPPIQLSINMNQQLWKTLFQRAKERVFTPEEIRTLTLRKRQNGNCLTIDTSTTERIEIAVNVSDAERQWLYQHIQSKYPPLIKKLT